MFLSYSPVRLAFSSDASSYRIGDSVVLAAAIQNDVAPVTGATVSAAIWPIVSVSTASISNYRLISQTSLGDVTQYEYAVDLVNSGSSASRVQATAQSS